jgi:hypothetical protein
MKVYIAHGSRGQEVQEHGAGIGLVSVRALCCILTKQRASCGETDLHASSGVSSSFFIKPLMLS